MAEELAWFEAQLHRRLQPYLSLTDEQLGPLYRHYRMLMRWNSKINLTSIRNPEEVVERHYCESLFFAAQVPDGWDGMTVSDIGSGAGFPGVPMAVLRPTWRVTLVESHQRKSVFLRESTRAIPNIAVVAGRAEQLGQAFDLLVSRAVAPADVLQLVPRVAGCTGLLLGIDDLAAVQTDTRLTWSSPIIVPWGGRRVCAFGTVSRGT